MSGPRGASRSTAGSERPVRPRGTAKDRALRLLGVRDRSRRELERRLLQAGFEPPDVDSALNDLDRAGLIDDERFAAAVVDQAMIGRPSGRKAVMTTLLSKGVARDLAEAAIARLADGEDTRAQALAERQAARWASLDPAAAYRRLTSLLLRRGFDPETARSAARRALGGARAEE